MSTKSKHRSYTASKHHRSAMLPLALMLLFLPSISYLHIYDPKLSEYIWFSNRTQLGDLFLYCKSFCFIALCTVMLLQIAWRAWNEKKFLCPKIFIPLAVYAALALLSCAFSSHKAYAFAGGYEQFESFWVLLGYCITAYYAYFFVQEEEDLRFLMHSFVIGVCISVLIGLSQAIDHNFWFTSLGEALRIPARWKDLVHMDTVFEKTRVYMSLYNPNYVGLYAAFIMPILLMLAIPDRSFGIFKMLPPVARTVLLFVLTAALGVCLLMSEAKNGFLALAAALLFAIFFLALRVRKRWYLSIAAFVGLAVLFFASDAILGHRITNGLKNFLSAEKTEPTLQKITFDGDSITITYQNNPVTLIIHPDNSCLMLDAYGNPLDADACPFPISSFIAEERLFLEATINGVEWYFCNDGEKAVTMSPTGKWGTISTPPSALFTGYESLFSGRGYIWSRTIPLLRNRILLGSGADTFLFEFPNDDFVGKYNYGFAGQIVTKPHSLYLQVAVQTGVLSLVALLVFYFWYFITSCRIYFTRKLDSYAARTGFGIFIGSIGYMVSSIVNDSTVAVAPVFWAMMGLGICINQKLLRMPAPAKTTSAKKH